MSTIQFPAAFRPVGVVIHNAFHSSGNKSVLNSDGDLKKQKKGTLGVDCYTHLTRQRVLSLYSKDGGCPQALLL